MENGAGGGGECQLKTKTGASQTHTQLTKHIQFILAAGHLYKVKDLLNQTSLYIIYFVLFHYTSVLCGIVGSHL